MHVTLGHLNNKSKTHCRADCHDEARIGHGFCKGVERLHRGEGNAGQKQAGGDEDQSCFIALDERPDRNSYNRQSNPGSNGLVSFSYG